MGTISTTLPSDGQTIDASDVNTPFNAILAGVNGNLDDDNIKTGANISGAKLADTSITNAKMSTDVKPYTLFDETTYDFVASGCVITGDSYGSTLKWSMTAGVVYINGQRVTVNALSAQDVVASKDTYVDVSTTGTVVFTGGNSVANNAASPALASGYLRLGIIVSGANIASVASINQGQEDKVLPIASSIPYAVTDSLGNLICPRDPNRRVLGYRQILSAVSTTNTSLTDATGLSTTVIVPDGRKIKISVYVQQLRSTQAAGNAMFLDIVEGSTVLADTRMSTPVTAYGLPPTVSTVRTATAGLHTYKVQYTQQAAGTVTLDAVSNTPAYILVELV